MTNAHPPSVPWPPSEPGPPGAPPDPRVVAPGSPPGMGSPVAVPGSPEVTQESPQGEASPAAVPGSPEGERGAPDDPGPVWSDDAAATDGDQPDGAGVWPTDEILEAVELDEAGYVRRDLEAILAVADEPVPSAVLAEAVGARLTQVEALLIDMAGEYARDGRGFVLRAVAGGWRLATHPGARTAVEAYLRAGQSGRLTRAALETLAVVAYRQPVTRYQVAAVRGVSVDGVFRTLLARRLIREVGHQDAPGQPVLYGTTPSFLEQLGLNRLDELPPIKDYLPEGVELVDLEEPP